MCVQIAPTVRDGRELEVHGACGKLDGASYILHVTGAMTHVCTPAAPAGALTGDLQGICRESAGAAQIYVSYILYVCRLRTIIIYIFCDEAADP